MKPETEIDETGSFGEPEEKPAPFWKRSVWGISVATWGLCAVVLLAAIWYLFLRAPSETGMPPFNDADAGVQTWQTTQESSPSVQSTETMTVRTGEDMSQLARDVKTELDTRFMINPETRVIAVDLNNVAGDKTPAGRLKTGIMYLLAGQIAGGDFTLPQYRDEVLKQLPREYHEIALKRINQLDQEVKTKVYDELHNARGIDFIWENLDTQEREQRKFAIRTVLSTQYLRDYPESVLKSANTLWLLRYKPEDIPVLRDNFNVPEFMLKRFLKMPEGPAPDGSGVPVLGVFRVKSGTLARILKFTVGPLELWALNSSPKDSALRKTLTNKLGSVRARKILAENFPRGSATSLIEHRAGQHNSDNVIEELASELIRKQGYNL